MNVTAAPLSLRALNQSKIYGSTFHFAGRSLRDWVEERGERGVGGLGECGSRGHGECGWESLSRSRSATRVVGTFNPSNYTLSYVEAR
jgi:hypothetical protein